MGKRKIFLEDKIREENKGKHALIIYKNKTEKRLEHDVSLKSKISETIRETKKSYPEYSVRRIYRGLKKELAEAIGKELPQVQVDFPTNLIPRYYLKNKDKIYEEMNNAILKKEMI